MTIPTLLLLVFLQAPADVRSDPTLAPSPQEQGTAEEQWRRTVLASRRASEELPPIEAFRLHAEVLTRQGVQSNEGQVNLAYLAPDLIRFALPDGKEVGRSGLKQREYWLRSSDRVVALEGREYEEDRRQIKSMHAVARNFIALSDPASLEVAAVSWLEGPPREIPSSLAREARRLRWLRLESPDFSLDGATSSGEELFRIDFGLSRGGSEEHLPLLAIVRDTRRGGRAAPPMLLRLGNYRELDDFRVPGRLEVFAPEQGLVPRFKAKPDQEIYLLGDSSLRAVLTPEDFRPE